ncbi:FHA domain-containing protein [Phormidium yuhuli AB48]|uniref:FHA domain-containing protein n=1 Tax=Phormidium yuhuli AB48 TaxID=2940671 RepID=A0ABY5ATQ2_9CYAN|nr:FHA domain-containing protein [Phormidium yuhuli]USR91518.1 FHA domain-containing protein [Phormidium yuhuli AB48]
MTDLYPYFSIQSPKGDSDKFVLQDTYYTIGRLPENDIPLSEDPNSRITRVKHCLLEREGGQWWVTDDSRNGIVVHYPNSAPEPVNCRTVALDPGCVIEIHGWKLEFHDPNPTAEPTRAPNRLKVTPDFVYKVSQATLFYQEGRVRSPIHPRPKVNLMLGYMAQRNLNQGEPVLCSYDELIEAVWGEDDSLGRTPADVNILARGIRILLEQNGSKTPKTQLETKKGQGYLLRISCEP